MTVHRRTTSSFRLAVTFAALVAACLAFLVAPAPARATDAIFAVSGRGWGHGIGMSQFGALGYARQGKTYDWILRHYFQKTDLSTRDVEPTVLVDIDPGKHARSQWRITAGSTNATVTVSDWSGGLPSVDVTRGLSVWLVFDKGDAVLYADRVGSGGSHSTGALLARFTDSARVQTSAAAKDSLVRFFGETGPFSEHGIAWRGQFQFRADDTDAAVGHAVDHVPMEQYLRGVVPRESPSSWGTDAMGGMEALKAQAVAARSYAYDAATSGTTIWCTTMSQVYAGANCLTDGHTHETARTDSAVTATAKKYVVYDGKVITTFFSSSSGGKTANSKDVWFSGSADTKTPVYYSSVDDADDVDENPNYRWSLSDMSGATMAAKIRDRDNGSDDKDTLDYSVASPATITSVTLDPGDSGFVRYVTMKWSNGKSFTIQGTTFQFALGMKSSAFTVKLKNPPAPPAPAPTRFQQADARPLWAGAWEGLEATAASGGSYRRTNATGASVTVMFKGSTVAWVGVKSSRAGKADVMLDGTRVATVDLYAATTSYNTKLWTKTGLSTTATHTLVVKVLGTHRTGSAGSYVYVDAIDITGTMLAVPRPPVWKRYEQGAAPVTYKGTWKTSSIAGLSGGTHAFSKEASATATFTFTGSQVRWIGKRARNYGKAYVSLDGGTAVLIDLYASTTQYQQRLFDSGRIAVGTHTLTVRVPRKKNAKSTDYYVDVDAFLALEPGK